MRFIDPSDRKKMQKKQQHAISERKRREKTSLLFSKLKLMIPSTNTTRTTENSVEKRVFQNDILQLSIDHIDAITRKLDEVLKENHELKNKLLCCKCSPTQNENLYMERSNSSCNGGGGASTTSQEVSESNSLSGKMRMQNLIS